MKAVLFDLGHTLIDYYDDWRAPEERAAARVSRLASEASHGEVEEREVSEHLLGLLDEGRRIKLREMIEIPLENVLTRCFSRFSLDNAPRLVLDSLDAFYGVLLEDRRLVNGTPEMLAEVRAMGYRIGLVSDVAWGLPSRYPRQDMRHYELDQYFDDLVFSTDVGIRKPSPEIFRLALSHVGSKADEAIFVGNNLQADIKGALDVGMRAILKRSGFYTHDDGIVPSARIAHWDELIVLLERAQHSH